MLVLPMLSTASLHSFLLLRSSCGGPSNIISRSPPEHSLIETRRGHFGLLCGVVPRQIVFIVIRHIVPRRGSPQVRHSLVAHPVALCSGLLACLTAVGMTGSRAGVLLTLVGLAFLANLHVMQYRDQLKRCWLVAGTVTVAVIMAFFVIGGIASSRVGMFGMGNPRRLKFFGRMVIDGFARRRDNFMPATGAAVLLVTTSWTISPRTFGSGARSSIGGYRWSRVRILASGCPLPSRITAILPSLAARRTAPTRPDANLFATHKHLPYLSVKRAFSNRHHMVTSVGLLALWILVHLG